MRSKFSFTLAVILTIIAYGAAHAEQRVALVIGNSAYTEISALSNPKNDAELMARTLRDIGFDVTTSIDANLLDMSRAIRNFGKALRLAGRDAVGLFYYAGHGVQSRGGNYLVPLGAIIENEADLELEAVSTSTVLSQMDVAGNALNLVILDACRNNPFKANFRSSVRGLARLQAASGTLVAFAAAPGQVAADGSGSNSPYTAALAEAMQKPDLSVEKVFKQVRISVESQTGGRQTPWEESSLTGDFHFVTSTRPSAPASVAATPPAPAPLSELDKEALFWQSIKGSQNPATFKEYLKKFPDGTFSGLAKVRLQELSRNTATPTQSPAVENKPAAQPSKPDTQTAHADPNQPAGNTATSPLADVPDRRALVRAIQTELDRHRCNPGAIDGAWGRNSERALNRFARQTKLKLTAVEPSQQVLDELRARKARACPLECGRRYDEQDGKCVLKTCKNEQVLSSVGNCVANQPPTQRTGSIAGTWGYRGKCPLFNSSGTFTFRSTGRNRFAGSHHNVQTGVSGTVGGGRLRGNQIAYTMRYTDLLGRKQTESFTGRLAANGSQINGSISGGWANGCQMTLTRR